MPNIGAVLKQEIQRLSRKASRAETDALKKASALHRKQISALRGQVNGLQATVNGLVKALDKLQRSQKPETTGEPVKVRTPGPKAIAAMRARLGVTVADFALLVGVSSQSIYNWEHGRAKPQGKQLQSLVALRGLGKRAVNARLGAIRGAA